MIVGKLSFLYNRWNKRQYWPLRCSGFICIQSCWSVLYTVGSNFDAEVGSFHWRTYSLLPRLLTQLLISKNAGHYFRWASKINPIFSLCFRVLGGHLVWCQWLILPLCLYAMTFRFFLSTFFLAFSFMFFPSYVMCYFLFLFLIWYPLPRLIFQLIMETITFTLSTLLIKIPITSGTCGGS